MKKILHIENLDCPVCAEALQSDLSKVKGVNAVSVDYVTQTITLDTDNEETVQKVIKKTNKFEEVRVLEEGSTLKKDGKRKEWLTIFLSALLFIAGILTEQFSSGTVGKVCYLIVYGAAYLAVGYPVLISTFKNIIKGRIFDENFLMTVASIGAVALGEYGEGVLVMLLYQLGELLQSIAVGNSRCSVAELMELKSETATVLKDGEWKILSPEEVTIGDVLLIKGGEKVPVDGILLSESATLDTKYMTGESEPKRIKQGEELLSGYINAGGVYEMKAVRPYEDSAVCKVLDMVENATARKAAPEKFITKFARVYTPIVCGLALLLAVVAPLVSGLIVEGRLFFNEFPRWAKSALTFLVVSCPCALIISVPLTYFTGIGVCAKKGILVKGAMYLDVAAKIKTVAFDKTGTLTEGNFTVCGVHVTSVTKSELLAVVAAIEKNSSHPIARAFSTVDSSDYIVDNVTEISGQGLCATIGKNTVLIGNEKLLKGHGFTPPDCDSIYTVIHVAKDGEYLGWIEVGDRLKEEAHSAVQDLKSLGIQRFVMLTGDRYERAQKIANEVGVYEVKAQLLPDEKLLYTEELKKDGLVMYVGDGVNDAPVMSEADCSVSMGTLGSAAAVEASDFVLISDNLKGLGECVRTAKRTRTIVMQNILFSILMKTGFMFLGAAGVLPLWLAVFADVGVMLLAVLNSFRVRIKKKNHV